MSDFKDNSANTISFSSSNTFSPPDGRLPRCPSLTFPETIDLWSHATLLFHNLEWEQALSTHRRILRQCGRDVRKGFLWFNIGAIRAVLGEYYLAAEAFAKALKYEPDFAVSWYCLGISLFELNDFRSAKKAFDRCLRSFAAEERVDCTDQGLDFVLEKTRVEWNCRQALLEKNYKKAWAPQPSDRHLGLNGMPAGTLYEPPSFGGDEEVDVDIINTASPEKSVGARSALSSSTKLRRGIQTLLRGQPKQLAKFEHSNPRLQALEDETSTDSELRKETIVSILAPSALTNSNNAQERPTFEAERTSQDDQIKKVSVKFSTWPRPSKPLSPLPFVTAKDLSTASSQARRSNTSSGRTRAHTAPQASEFSQQQPSATVIYHEGSIITTEYIPATQNTDAFMHTAPMALVQDSPSRPIPHSDMPAPLSISKRPQTRPIRPAPPSPTSIYSRPFSSSPNPETVPTPFPRNPLKPKPTTAAATQSWLDTTFPPPRWDSLPPHLRPARRPSRHQQWHPERRQRPAPSVHTGVTTPLGRDTRHLRPPTPFANSFPNDDLDHNTAPLRPPAHHRDSTASMDSVAIIGMGSQAARWEEGVGWINDDGMDARTGTGAGTGTGTAGEEQSRSDGDGKRGRGNSRWPGLGGRKRG